MVKILINIALLYLVIIALVYVFQKKLIFFPQKLPRTADHLTNDSTVESIKIHSGDADYLQGWLCKKTTGDKLKIIIYFGGNAEEVSHLISQSHQIKNRSLLLINYPGYGNSDGNPGEKEFFDASLKIYDYVMSRNDIDSSNIIVMGRSLGTAVATYLASKRKVSGVILISPFASMSSVAKEHHPFLPVGLLLKHKFDSKKYAKNIRSPLLCIYGTDDTIIPSAHSKELIKYWGGKTECYELAGFDHNNLLENEKAWNYINDFLNELR